MNGVPCIGREQANGCGTDKPDDDRFIFIRKEKM